MSYPAQNLIEGRSEPVCVHSEDSARKALSLSLLSMNEHKEINRYNPFVCGECGMQFEVGPSDPFLTMLISLFDSKSKFRN